MQNILILRCIYESILQTTFVILAFLDEKVLILSHLLLPSKNSEVNTLGKPSKRKNRKFHDIVQKGG